MSDSYTLLLNSSSNNYTPMYATKTLENMSIEDIISNTEISDWKCLKQPNNREDKQERINGSFYLERDDNNQVLTPYVGAAYEVVQYPEGLKWLEYFLEEGLLTIDSALLLGGGKEFAVTTNIQVEAEVLPGDKIHRFLTLALSHSKSPRGLFYTDIRSVCENTLSYAKQTAINDLNKAFVLDDSNALACLQKAKRMIDLAKNTFFEKDLNRYKAYQQLDLSYDQVDGMIRKLLNLPLLGELETLDTVSDKSKDNYQSILDSTLSSPGTEFFKYQQYTGYRLLNGVTYAAQTIGKKEVSRYKNNLGGVGGRWRRQTTEMLDTLLPAMSIPV